MTPSRALLLAALIPVTAIAGATASNFQKENRLGTNYWNAQSAIDGKLETAWMVPGDSPNLGEWIMLDVPKGTIDKIAIVPGWAKSDETWSDHPRVKKMLVEVLCCQDTINVDEMSTTGTTHIELADKPGRQIVDVEDLQVGNELFGGKVKLSVVEVYEGKDFPNLGVSEVVIHMSEFDAAATPSEPSAEAEGHMLIDAYDEDKKTFWAAPAEGAGFTLTADGYGVSTVLWQHGPKGYARAKTVKVTANNREAIVQLPDEAGFHPVTVPPIVGYTGSAWGPIRLDVVEVYEGDKPEVAVSELKVKATNYEGL